MQHIAFLAKKKKLLAKILSGEKTIESRWYVNKKTPYGTVKAGDTLWFKETGDPVTARATVEKALFFDLRQTSAISILKEHGTGICAPIKWASAVADKRYCTLVFLTDVQRVEPFKIDKTGYGNMAAWITVEDINRIKRSSR